MRFTGVFAASITLFSISALASNVVEVTSKSFDSVVGKSAGALVELLVYILLDSYFLTNTSNIQLRAVVVCL